MKGRIRILHLEDNDSDSELVTSYLSAEKIASEIIRVSSEEEFLKAIRTQDFQIIISDFSLPTINGIEALKITREIRPDIPFLFFSGTIGEEYAIETLKQGATDYVLKDRMARLGPAIYRALQEANERKLRLKAEEDLQKSQERYRLVVELSPDMIFVESGGRIVFMNPAGMRLLGAIISTEILGKPLSELIVPEQRETLQASMVALMRGQKGVPHEFKMLCVDGRTVDVELTGSLVQTAGSKGILGIARNITDRKRMEEELRHSQKMEAVGQLAGGLAHDFNNTLMAIYGYAEILMTNIPPAQPNHKYVEGLLEVATKGASLTRQLMAFSRKQHLDLRLVNLSRVVEDLDDMLRLLVGDSVHLEVALQEDLYSVHADVGRLERILMNLAVNSRDAMPEGGVLRIFTSKVHFPENGVHHSGTFARLTVQDSGTGMSEEVKARCFEPFYTTKEEGKGTGLGLSNVYAIVRQMNAYISVESSPETGTTFNIDFPAAETSTETDTKDDRKIIEPDAMQGRTILLVDDNELVLRALSSAFQRFGGKLLTARDGVQALELEQHESQVDLLITDVMMPHMNGFQLAEQMRKRRQGLKVIFISGYAEETVNSSMQNDLNSAFVSKPASLMQLVENASRLLHK